MKVLIAALIGTVLSGCVTSVDKEATIEPPPRRLTIPMAVKQVSSDARNNPTIELSHEEDGIKDGLLIAFITAPGYVDVPSESSGPQEIERFIEFRAPAGGETGIARLIARHFGAEEIDLFNGEASVAGMLLPPEKLPGSGGNFRLHEGRYLTRGYRDPVIRLSFNCVFAKGSNKVTLIIFER